MRKLQGVRELRMQIMNKAFFTVIFVCAHEHELMSQLQHESAIPSRRSYVCDRHLHTQQHQGKPTRRSF